VTPPVIASVVSLTSDDYRAADIVFNWPREREWREGR
jgi:hypothetical protein